jgi:hypothetical protein
MSEKKPKKNCKECRGNGEVWGNHPWFDKPGFCQELDGLYACPFCFPEEYDHIINVHAAPSQPPVEADASPDPTDS